MRKISTITPTPRSKFELRLDYKQASATSAVRDQLQLRASFFCDVIGGAPPTTCGAGCCVAVLALMGEEVHVVGMSGEGGVDGGAGPSRGDSLSVPEQVWLSMVKVGLV